MSQVIDGDQKRECGIQAAGDAQVKRLTGGKLFDPLGKSRALDAEDLGAATVQLGPSGGHKRRTRNFSLQPLHILRQLERNRRKGRTNEVPSSKLVVIRRSACSLATSTSWVIQYESRRIGRPSPTRGDSASKPAVLGDQAVAAENHVGRRLGWPAAGHRVRRDQSARLAHDQLGAIPALANGFVAGREVEQERRSGHGLKSARGQGHPKVLANLDAHDDRRRSRSGFTAPELEEKVDPERHASAPQLDLAPARCRRPG